MPAIRAATTQDREQIRQIHLNAFPDEEKQLVAELASNLLSESTNPNTLSLVAETDNRVIGHIAFSPVSASGNDQWQGYILAPLAVSPDCQNSGVGSQLIKTGIQQLSAAGANALFVYGDPKYYGKFGFEVEAASNYVAPYPLEFPFGWQVLILDNSTAFETPKQLSCVASLSKPELW